MHEPAVVAAQPTADRLGDAGEVVTAFDACPQTKRRVETDLEPKTLKTGHFGGWPPAAQMAGTLRSAGILAKKKGPEIVRALQFGGGVEPRTKRLLKVRNRSAANRC